MTPSEQLESAVRQDNDAAACRAALAAGADPNMLTDGGWPVFTCAARYSSLETCQALLASGARIDVLDQLGWSPLTHAAARGRLDICTWLLDHGADANQMNKDNVTPLVMAALTAGDSGDTELCVTLVQRGARADEALAFMKGARLRVHADAVIAAIQAEVVVRGVDLDIQDQRRKICSL